MDQIRQQKRTALSNSRTKHFFANLHLAHEVVILLLSLSITVSPLVAQSVHGFVTDATTGLPVARGFIVLLDEGGQERARVPTTATGNFSLQAPTPGRYLLRSERIGYGVWESEFFTLTTDQVLELSVTVISLPTQLATLVVTAEDRCGDIRGTDSFDPIWEEARKALEAATWTAQQGYSTLLHRYDRSLTRNSGVVEREDIWGISGRGLQPFAAISADSLLDLGYIIEVSNALCWYFGPDANVLLDESFHRTHCFRASHGDGDNFGLVGIGFRPDPARTLPEIEGTLWLDAATSELRRIEWQYVNTIFDVSDERIGGQALFHALPSGAWIIKQWHITMPIVARHLVDGHRGMHVLVGLQEAGGEVIELRGMNGQSIYVSPKTAVFRGTTFDSTRRAPSANQLVSILGTRYTTQTNAEGHFVFKTLLDGEYALTLARMDSLGFLQGRERMTVHPGDTVDVDLIIPSLPSVQRFLCPGSLIPEGSRALVGTVTYQETGDPVKDMDLFARWSPLNSPYTGLDRLGSTHTRTDLDGNYAFCSLPMNKNIQLELNSRNYAIDPVQIVFDGYRVVIDAGDTHDLYLTFDRIGKVDLVARPDSSR